jgi:hypothetical protein
MTGQVEAARFARSHILRIKRLAKREARGPPHVPHDGLVRHAEYGQGPLVVPGRFKLDGLADGQANQRC